MSDFPEIKEIDINPLIIDEKEAVAVDARIVIDAERITEKIPSNSHLVIAPYPQKYVTEGKLQDGTPVLLRPIKPEDEGRLNALFKSLSEETLRLRFFEIIKEMSHETLTRYCNLDYAREIAIVAELKPGDRQIIGAVGVIIDPDGKSGEFAVLVGDKWQGFGLGSKLMDSIVEVARDLGLRKIYGYVIARNYRMLNMIAKKGFKTEPWDEETVKATLLMS